MKNISSKLIFLEKKSTFERFRLFYIFDKLAINYQSHQKSIYYITSSKLQDSLKDLKKDIQEVNWSRKNKQTQVGEKLKNLETQWVGLVSKNYEIEQAIVQLEAAFPAGTLPKEDEESEDMDQQDDM